jgi:hypothetical protein
MIREEINLWFQSKEEKAARKWNKEKCRKERNRREVMLYIKGSYEIRQITEEEKFVC